MDSTDFSSKAKQLIDDIKGICASAGLGGDANEYKIVTQSFLYKFLNDKFLFEIVKLDPKLKSYDDLKKLSSNEYDLLMMKLGTKAAHLKPEHLLEYLFQHQNDESFAKLFDATLNDIALDNSDVFSVHTAGDTEIRLFEEELIQDAVNDKSKQDGTAHKLINKIANSKFDFTATFSAGFDFFSTLFEYMIKDYNKDGGGKYAEYYTPHSIAKIMAEILVGDSKPNNVMAYDPAAGSGTLLMNIAYKIGPDKCTIYSEDISQKSSNLLRLNLILNNLTHSIDHVVQGNTITNPKHITKKFDFIVSNPPFKIDFSGDRETIMSLPNLNDRFFAGIPNTPNKDKDKMSIYLLFIQHILFSLSDTGRAAIVVPTGFLTAKNGIEKIIRTKLIEKKWLKGVVSMPSNIFATTGTNVSVIFIDKTSTNKVILVDASKLGTKIKDGKNQKTLLSHEEEQKIIDVFSVSKSIENFSVVVSFDEIKEKNYNFNAGQFFNSKNEYIEISNSEYVNSLKEYQIQLNNLFVLRETLEKIAKIIFEYWFLQFDFPDKHGNTYKSNGGKMIWNEELHKEIPNEWKVSKLGTVLKTSLGGTPDTHNASYWDGGDIAWISSGETDSFPILKTNNFITQDGLENSPAVLLPKGSIVMSIVRYIRVSILGINASTNQSVVGIKETETLRKNYLYPFLKSQIAILMSKRTGAQQPHINKGEVDSIYLVIPDKRVLERYYEITEPIYTALTNYRLEEKDLNLLRDELLSSLINSQLL